MTRTAPLAALAAILSLTVGAALAQSSSSESAPNASPSAEAATPFERSAPGLDRDSNLHRIGLTLIIDTRPQPRGQ